MQVQLLHVVLVQEAEKALYGALADGRVLVGEAHQAGDRHLLFLLDGGFATAGLDLKDVLPHLSVAEYGELADGHDLRPAGEELHKLGLGAIVQDDLFHVGTS